MQNMWNMQNILWNFNIKYINKLILHSRSVHFVLLPIVAAVSSVVYCMYFYPIIVQLACVVRFYDICPGPAEAKEQVPEHCKWTDIVSWDSQLNLETVTRVMHAGPTTSDWISTLACKQEPGIVGMELTELNSQIHLPTTLAFFFFF